MDHTAQSSSKFTFSVWEQMWKIATSYLGTACSPRLCLSCAHRLRHQLEHPEFIGAKQVLFHISLWPHVFLYFSLTKTQDHWSQIHQWSSTGTREGGDEICSQQSGLQVVSKQANNFPILESTRVDSEWHMIAKWSVAPDQCGLTCSRLRKLLISLSEWIKQKMDYGLIN